MSATQLLSSELKRLRERVFLAKLELDSHYLFSPGWFRARKACYAVIAESEAFIAKNSLSADDLSMLRGSSS